MPPAHEVEKLLAEMSAVWRFAVHLCEVRHAETLVQETFVRVFRDPWPVARDGAVEPRLVLFKVLHDVAHEHERKRATSSAIDRPSASEAIEFLPPMPADSQVSVDPPLQAAICSLPLADRAVFLLSVVERLRYSEIAMIVGTSMNEVSKRLNTTRLHVAAWLANERDPGDQGAQS